MQEDVQIVVDDQPFRIATFPARKAHKLLVRLLGLAGVPLTSVIEAGGLNAEDAEKLMLKIFGQLSQSYTPEVADALLMEILSGVYPDQGEFSNVSVASRFDTAFAGNILLAYKLAWECLKVQFKDFSNVPVLLQKVFGKPGTLKSSARKT